jgi:hypothetical protein
MKMSVQIIIENIKNNNFNKSLHPTALRLQRHNLLNKHQTFQVQQAARESKEQTGEND